MDEVKWLKLLICLLMLMRINGFRVPITLVQDAVAKGGELSVGKLLNNAVCLDGSPPAYHIDKGSGDGVNNWLIHMEGGAWCNNATSCLERTKEGFGSSKLMSKLYTFGGILDNQPDTNPDFYNWNKVEIRYCDGSSFTGDVDGVDPEAKVFYRGARLWSAVMDDLLALGMNNAQNAILGGCSSGGLAAILQCDNFRALLPCHANVKCFSDAGFFINTKDISGVARTHELFTQVVTTHGSAKNLPASCTSQLRPELCFFPEHAAKGIQTPLFIVNSAYDSWQIDNTLAPGVADPLGTWRNCKNNLLNCSDSQLLTLQGFRTDFIAALTSQGNNPSRGLFINSCYWHCQTLTRNTWLRDDSPVLDNTTIAKAVGDWYFDRKPFQKIDCPYPCNKSCHNRVFG